MTEEIASPAEELVTSEVLLYKTADGLIKLQGEIPLLVCVVTGEGPRVIHNLQPFAAKGIILEMYQQIVGGQ